MTPDDVGVVFDLDGTLVDSEPYWVRGFSTGLAAILRERGHGEHDLDPGQMWRFQGGRVPDTVRRILTSLDLRPPLEHTEVETIVELTIEAVTADFRERPAPVPEAVEAARRLHRDGVPMAVCSSSALSFIDAALDVLDLSGAFPVRVSAVGLPHGKPDPDVYLRTLVELGLAAERAVAVEDSPVGVAAAVNAGMSCLWFLRDQGGPGGLPDDPLALLVGKVADPSRLERLVTVSTTLDADQIHRLLGDLDDRSARS